MNRETYIQNVLNELGVLIEEEAEQDYYALGWNKEDVVKVASYICDNIRNIDGDKADIAETLSCIVFDSCTDGPFPPEALLALVALKVFRHGAKAVCDEFVPR